MRVRTEADRPDPRKIQPAMKALRSGKVIIYPSDTGYAYACALSSAKGIATLRRLKGMDERHRQPLSLLVGDLREIGHYTHLENYAFRVVRRLLPGAYTVVLPASSHVPRSARNRDHELGVRWPEHALCNLLVAELGEPIVSGSVDHSEDEPELQEPELLELRGGKDVAVIIDDGALWPMPSTVLRVADGEVVVLREGQGEINLP